jgi:hypothetical protein
MGPDGDLLATVTTLEQADVKLDLAVLPKLTDTAPGLALARRSATLAQKVMMLGLKKGAVRPVADRTVTHVEPDSGGRMLLRLSAQMSAKDAGSPVVNTRGELIAIAVGTLPGRETGDVAIDVTTIRELLAKPVARLAFPSRDGTITAAKAPTPDPKSPAGAGTGGPDVGTKPRAGSIFPERYGNPVSADTAGTWEVALFGCARLESRQKVYCYLRIQNLATAATITINGGDLADSTRKKVGEAENLIQGETSQRVAGWRKKATLPLREMETVRVALEFVPPKRDTDAVRVLVDIDGERTLSLGPFILQRVP